MSTELKTNMLNHEVVKYFGGDRSGMCLQVTHCETNRYIQLDMIDAAALAKVLADFVLEEATRRQALLRKHNRDSEIAVQREISNMDFTNYKCLEGLAFMTNALCPRWEGCDE